MPEVRTVNDLEIDTARVFLRADLNVPVTDGEVSDTTRIDAITPTIALLRERGCRIILGSHFGRPRGEPRPEYSLEQIRQTVSDRLGLPIQWSSDCFGDDAERLSSALEPGQVLLLENLRFHPGEESNDEEFARSLAKLADAYVNDAFGASHREHASIVALPRIFGHDRSAAGLLLARELEFLDRIRDVDDDERPFVAVLGGAKIQGKIEPLRALARVADTLLVGGGMANTLLAAGGANLGSSLVDHEMLETARELLDSDVELVLPVDLVLTDSIENPSRIETIRLRDGSVDIPEGMMAVDIGDKTVEKFEGKLHHAGMVFWNGPMGVFEREEFSKGTRAIADAVAHSQGVSIVGGGESVDAVNQAGVAAEVSHVSTGGGAALELIAGNELPGVAVLRTDGSGAAGD